MPRWRAPAIAAHDRFLAITQRQVSLDKRLVTDAKAKQSWQVDPRLRRCDILRRLNHRDQWRLGQITSRRLIVHYAQLNFVLDRRRLPGVPQMNINLESDQLREARRTPRLEKRHRERASARRAQIRINVTQTGGQLEPDSALFI